MKKRFILLCLLLTVISALASCEYIESQHNHKYSKLWTSDEEEHWRQASCEHTDLIVNRGAHTFDNGVQTTDPTEYEEGVLTFTCTVCKYTKTQPISRLPHTHTFDTDNYEYNSKYHWHNATCEHSYLSTPAQLHNRPINNVCIDCGHLAESQKLSYTLLPDGSYEVVGRGECTDTQIVIPATYEGKPVTSIGAYAFQHHNGGIGIHRVVIPSTVTKISEGAFYEQFSLKEVIFEGKSSLNKIEDYAFYRCDEFLTSFTIPMSVKYIGEAVFQTCEKLTEIVVEEGNAYYKSIDGHLYTADGTKLLQYALGKTDTEFVVPDSVSELGIGVFASSPYLNKITFNIDSAITTIPKHAFYYSVFINEIQLPEAVTVIEESAFSFCQALKVINIPQNLVTVGNEAFNLCKSLPDFEIPATVKTIGANAFAYCESLTRIDIPDGVTYIGDSAMEGCIGAIEITIPKSVISYGNKMFFGSSNLKNIIVDPQNTVLTSINGNLYTKNEKTLIHYCTAKEETGFVVPNTVETIRAWAFYSCKNLQNVELPTSLKSIELSAFQDCSNLVSINLPEGLRTVGQAAFRNCRSLSSIAFPSTLATLPTEMLLGCDSITSLVIPSTVTRIEKHAIGFLKLTNIEFANTDGWVCHYTTVGGESSEAIPSELLSGDTQTAIETATVSYCGGNWVWTNP